MGYKKKGIRNNDIKSTFSKTHNVIGCFVSIPKKKYIRKHKYNSPREKKKIM